LMLTSIGLTSIGSTLTQADMRTVAVTVIVASMICLDEKILMSKGSFF
jgi:hypothetical protein